jgi:hypothetical protein
MAYGRVEDENLLVAYLPDAKGRVNDANLLVAYLPEAKGRVNDVSMFVGYIPYAPPWPQVGFQSGVDAIEDLPNSGATSPFFSNRDAERGIK